jgi:hypothetical protein
MNFSREDEQTFAIDLKAVVIPLDDVIKTVVMERPGTGSDRADSHERPARVFMAVEERSSRSQ